MSLNLFRLLEMTHLSQQLSKTRWVWPAFTLLVMGVTAWFLWLSLSINRDLPPESQRDEIAAEVNNARDAARPQAHMSGESARIFLEQTSEGQSLMQAVTEARFGLKWQALGPGDAETGAGYLGMSHDQNLNTWFGKDGVTVRPTVSEQKSQRSWHLDMRLKAYGYGDRLSDAPPIVSHRVKGNRIEYQRAENFEVRLSDFGLQDESIFNRQDEIRNPKIVEWYENRAEGIEQGFTIDAHPKRESDAGEQESLRLVLSLNGDLRAAITDNTQAIELTDATGRRTLSYSKLTALDADGKHLPSHMEVGEGGSEISLVVDDRNAKYPVVIDPIVASLERILDSGNRRQPGAQAGFAVAIEFDRAVVGAWQEDQGLIADAGSVYVFSRTGSTWSLSLIVSGSVATGSQCGYAVAISGNRVAFGCPGVNSSTGKASVFDFSNSAVTDLVPPANVSSPGNSFGNSVAISGSMVVVGARFYRSPTVINAGAIHVFSPTGEWQQTFTGVDAPGGQLGNSVAVDGETVVAGIPGDVSGGARVYTRISTGEWGRVSLAASDGQAGDSFGETVALSGNTAVISAFGDDDRGIDAGAAYVFIRDAGGQWTQQQKLTASDARANDLFSARAVAIEGNTIVVGAFAQDAGFSDINDDRGAAYIFTRSETLWTEQRRIRVAQFDGGAPGNHFGISVDISASTVIVGASDAPGTDGTLKTGAAYVYRLDCLPPTNVLASFDGIFQHTPERTFCPGDTARIGITTTVGGAAYQWRKNGVNIPGATAETYVINSVTIADVGSYDVIVSNSCGADISSSAQLNLHTFNLNLTSQNFGAAGSNSSVNVTSSGACSYTATSNASWITITSGASGPVPGTVGFNVAANTSQSQRTGTLTIGGRTFTVIQDGLAPPPNVVQFSASSFSVSEDCTTVAITVNRIGGTSGAASVDYATSDVTATERRDYTTALGRLRFAPGETSKSFAVLISEDSFVEGAESFSVTLTNPAGASLGVAVATVQINDDPTEPASNAIDDPQTFVGQHYHDFLNRQADASGLAFWTNQITSCGADQACIQIKRVNVSAAYFLSIEFQQTGYLVERIYKTAYGDASGTSTFGGTHQLPVPIVRFQEFLRDTQQIGQGVVVGQTGWETVIENNKQGFTADFAQRSRFTTAFPTSMTPAQFVDTLNGRAGNPLSTSERNQLVNDLSTNGKTRAQVLRTIAEHPSLVAAESNRAFVLMQYFGYLRRNPNDPQDSDYTGYDFWLTKLNQFNGNFVNADMVKAFSTSSEYRGRFGQQ